MATLAELFEDYSPSVVMIEVAIPSGDLAVGTGFHIGNGYIVTARHVVEGVTIKNIVGGERAIEIAQILTHDDEAHDIAVLQTNFTLNHYLTKTTIVTSDGRRQNAKTDHIPLGYHLSDWVDNSFVMSKVLLMGFPYIAGSRTRQLVAVGGEVNAIVDRHGEEHPHFIISPFPRGGFSGGPVISEWGFLLGVLTEEFISHGEQYEPGFSAVLSIEPLLDILAANGIWPPGFDKELKDEWEHYCSRFSNGGIVEPPSSGLGR